MSSAFQPGAFQYNAFQIDPGQIRSPFYAPNPDVRFQGWQWQPQPVNLQLYPPTTRTFLNPWQSVYTWDSGPGLWQGMYPSAADPIPLLTQQIIYAKGGQVPTKFWRYDYVPDPVWQGAPDAATPLPLLGIEPFAKLWRYDTDTDVRQWTWEAPPANYNLLGGQVPTKLWRWDYDSGATQWTWQPPGSDTLDMLVEGGNPFHKLWRYDTDTDVRLWSWQPAPVFPSDFPFTEPFSKFWRYDVVPDPPWSPGPQSSNFNLLGGQVPTKLWRYDFDSGATAWTWQPPGSQTLDMLVEGGTPFHRLWRYDTDTDIRLWQWPGVPTTQAQLGLAINPFFRLWRYDVDTDVRTYNWPPQLSSALFMLVEGGQPFHKLWRYDLDTHSWWQGAPSGSNFNILGGKVPTKFWRWDHVPDPPWQLGPMAAPFNVLGGKVPTKFWRWDLDVGAAWAWQPPPVNQEFAVQKQQPFARLWRYDETTDSWWQGSPNGVPFNVLSGNVQRIPRSLFYAPRPPPPPDWTWLPPPVPPLVVPPLLPTNVVLLQDDDDTWSFYLLVDGTLYHVSAQYASTYPFFSTLIYWPFSYRTALSGPLSNDPPVPVMSTKDPGLMAVWAFRGSISAALVQWAAQQAQTLH